jgi:hypothetical protein
MRILRCRILYLPHIAVFLLRLIKSCLYGFHGCIAADGTAGYGIHIR